MAELLEAVGGENNPQHLWPVVYDGFEGLVRRKNEAETEMKAQEEFLAAVISATRQIMQWAVRRWNNDAKGEKQNDGATTPFD